MYLFTLMLFFRLTIKTYLSPQLPYVFIFILSFRLNAEIYPSTFLLLYMYADAPGYQYTCSVYFFLFGITCSITFPLSCWDTYTQINMFYRLDVLTWQWKNSISANVGGGTFTILFLIFLISFFNSRKKWVKHKLKTFCQIYICFVKSIQKTNRSANVKQKSMYKCKISNR